MELSTTKIRKYADRLRQLENKTHKLTPQQVLDDAKNKNSPLHEYFEWNNTIAGEKHRLNQARELIRTIKVEVAIVGGGSINIREYYSVVETNEETADTNNRAYVSIKRVEAEPEIREQVIAQALTEANRWKEKYNQYVELRNISDAISKTNEKIKNKKPISIPNGI